MRGCLLVKICVIALVLAASGGLARAAQTGPAVVAAPATPVQAAPLSAEGSRLMQAMTPVDSITLQAGNTRVTLWGLRPVPPSSSPFPLKAVDLMDGLIAGAPVSCRIVVGAPPDVLATCISANGADLGLELLNNGLAVADRRQVAGSSFAATYLKAQETARMGEKGIWRLIAAEDREARSSTWLKPILPFLVPLALFLGPLAGLLITVFMMRSWLRQMSAMLHEEREISSRKESILSTREKYVLISTLEGELSENRNKVDAFLMIYRDMLKGLEAKGAAPKYQLAGDIVQKHPALSKVVFDANLGKMSLLDMKLAGQLSKVYTALPTGHEYINLDPTMPIEQAVEIVSGVLKKAEELTPTLDQAVQALQAAAAAKAA